MVTPCECYFPFRTSSQAEKEAAVCLLLLWRLLYMISYMPYCVHALGLDFTLRFISSRLAVVGSNDTKSSPGSVSEVSLSSF